MLGIFGAFYLVYFHKSPQKLFLGLYFVSYGPVLFGLTYLSEKLRNFTADHLKVGGVLRVFIRINSKHVHNGGCCSIASA